MFADLLLLDAAVSLVIASGILLGVALAQVSRGRPEKGRELVSLAMPADSAQITAHRDTAAVAQDPLEADGTEGNKIGVARNGTAATGGGAILVAVQPGAAATPTPLMPGTVAGPCRPCARLSSTA